MEMTQLLLEYHGGDIRLIYRALKHKNYEMIEILLEDCHVRNCFTIALYIAVDHNDLRLARMTLDYDAKLYGQELELAVRKNSIEMVRLLLAYRIADIDVIDNIINKMNIRDDIYSMLVDYRDMLRLSVSTYRWDIKNMI
jgi:hypothetical protein